MNTLDFWTHINEQVDRLEEARTIDRVLAICPPIPGLTAADGFFEGSGGDRQVYGALREAGWTVIRFTAIYYWAMSPPEGGGVLEYVEGDLYRVKG